MFKSLFTVEQLAEVRGGVNCKRVSYNPLTYMVSDLVETPEERNKQTRNVIKLSFRKERFMKCQNFFNNFVKCWEKDSDIMNTFTNSVNPHQITVLLYFFFKP